MSSMFTKEKTNRGFELFTFKDDYGKKCTLQESSSWIPHIWLGIHTPTANIHWNDAQKLGLDLPKKHPEAGERGWCDYPIPEEVMLHSRMHLNQQQAYELAQELLYFAETGNLRGDNNDKQRTT